MLQWAAGADGGLAAGRSQPAPRGRPREYTFELGKYKGMKFSAIMETDGSYIKWLCENFIFEFPRDTPFAGPFL